MLLPIALEITALIIGFFIAAEVVAKGTDMLESLVGQGMAGGVVLGLIGSLPETIFVIVVALKGSFPIAIGSAVGGNIILFTMGMGAIVVAYTLKWRSDLVMKEDYHVDIWFLTLSTAGIALLLVYGSLNLVSGLLLCALYAVYLVYRYLNAERMIRKNASTAVGRRLMLKGLAFIAVGVVIVTILSGPFADTINELSLNIAVPAVWLALVISPIANDFGDNISAYRLAVRSRGGGSTAIVSFIGGKLENNTVLLGLIGIISGGGVSVGMAAPELLLVILVNIIATLFIIRGRLNYKQGLLLMLLYFLGIGAAFLA